METELRIVGVDPGGTTGVAVVTWDRVTYKYRLGFTSASTLGPADVADSVNGLAPDAVAVEQFVVGRRSARSKSARAGEQARNIVGALVAAFPALYRHTAHDVKLWATDERLKAAGLYRAGSGPHIRDATRHALFTLRKHYRAPDPLSAGYAPYRED